MEVSLSLAESSGGADAAELSILLPHHYQTSRVRYYKVGLNLHRFSCYYNNSNKKKKKPKTNPQLNVPSAGMKRYTDTENNNLLCLLNPELHLAGTRQRGERSRCNEAPRDYKDRDNCSFVSLHINLTKLLVGSSNTVSQINSRFLFLVRIKTNNKKKPPRGTYGEGTRKRTMLWSCNNKRLTFLLKEKKKKK